jgi:hypothetical protein
MKLNKKKQIKKTNTCLVDMIFVINSIKIAKKFIGNLKKVIIIVLLSSSINSDFIEDING